MKVLFFYQLDAKILYFHTFIAFLYMFRALLCSSPGGQIVLTQHLVSSLSLSDCSAHGLRRDSYAQILYYTFIIFLYMFRALLCLSSGGQIVLTQHLASSLSLGDCSAHRLRKDSHAQILYYTFIMFLYMFRALLCLSSGGQIVLTQHLVSSLSLGDCSVQRLREDECLSLY